MNIGIYGADVSGYYASLIMKLQGHTLIFFIDRKGEISDTRIIDDIPVYDSFENVAKYHLEELDLIFIALGDELESRELATEIGGKTSVLVKSVHEDPYFSVYSQMINMKFDYLVNNGFYKSLRVKQSVDLKGKPLIWITYPCIEFLRKRITPSMKVFEYGAGNSTLWWADRVQDVISIEHDQEWFDRINQYKNTNINLIFKKLIYNGDYSKEVLNWSNLDVIVIDGRDRVNCAINSFNSLSESGVIIWDDSERKRYQKGVDFLLGKGFKKIDFPGMKPNFTGVSQTSIFYREKNCLGI